MVSLSFVLLFARPLLCPGLECPPLPFSKADPPFELSPTPGQNHSHPLWLFSKLLGQFLSSSFQPGWGLSESSSPSWLYPSWPQRWAPPGPAFPLSIFFFFFGPCFQCPPDSHIGKASHRLTRSLWNTTGVGCSKPTCLLDSTSDVLASAQNLEIYHQWPNSASSFLLKGSPFNLFPPRPAPGY